MAFQRSRGRCGTRSFPNTPQASLKPAPCAAEMLAAAAVEVLKLLAEGYRARVARDSHYRHWSAQSVLYAEIWNSVPDVHDRNKTIGPCAINVDRHIAIPATQGQTS